MNPSRAVTVEYCSFICNPQKDGVWSMRVELTEKQAAALGSFLNINQHVMYPSRRLYSSFSRRPSPRFGGEGRPPILLPRLFAYLRAAIPKKERSELPDLSPQAGMSSSGRDRFNQRRRSYSFLSDLLTPPTTLGAAKRKRLSEALKIYRQHFQSCRIMPVPDNLTKIDIMCRKPTTYMQVTEELPLAIRISSPCEATLHEAKKILDSVLHATLDVETTKVFSPENTLLEMYIPILNLLGVGTILKDKTAVGNVAQALDEAQEERFVHAIRAIGIAAEELLVEIYETYLREKAPEAPLGNLINDLNSRLQEIVQGVKATKDNPLTAARRLIGKAIDDEKKGNNNQGVLALAEQLQKNVFPLLESLKQCVEENPSLNLKAQKINLFPSHVQRCLSELVILRNRVSHRVEKAVSVASVGYTDTAIALRDLIVVAKWWETERKEINYKATRKSIIQDTVKRSKTQGQATDEMA